MLDALLKGKVSRQVEGMEDMLTSSIFGTFKYHQYDDMLVTWLNEACLEDRKTFREIGKNITVDKIDFWPYWSESGCIPCEPDIVIYLSSGQTKWLVLVEAKYRSGKSSEANDEEKDSPPNDQLAKEWDNLTKRVLNHDTPEFGMIPKMIYLTTGFAYPKMEIDASCKDFHKCTTHHNFECYWLSWRHLHSLLEKHRNSRQLEDLFALLQRFSLFFYHGFHEIIDYQNKWSFLPFSFHNKKRQQINWEFIPFDFSNITEFKTIWRYNNEQ